MSIPRFLLFVCMLGLAAMAGADALQEDRQQMAAQQLSQRFAAMQSMRANFHQQIKDETGAVLQDASGQVVVRRPRQFYWHTTDPYEHLIVASGDVLWIYDVDLEQVTRQPFSNDYDRAPALILSGETDKLAQQYRIAVQASAQAGKSGQVFTLVPRQSGQVFSQLVLEFVDDRLLRMSLLDNFQQTTHIDFTQVEYNPAIAADQFEFTPPAGIDVIVNEP